jgi:hypothetical protein
MNPLDQKPEPKQPNTEMTDLPPVADLDVARARAAEGHSYSIAEAMGKAAVSPTLEEIQAANRAKVNAELEAEGRPEKEIGDEIT